MDELIGTIKAFGFNFVPRQWEACNGQLMSIVDNQALFSLLGNAYGGDGVNNFKLPDLTGRTMVGGTVSGNTRVINIAQNGGHESVLLTINNLPSHYHALAANATVQTDTAIIATEGPGTNDLSEPHTLGHSGAFPNIYAEAGTNQASVGGVVSVSSISGTTETTGFSAPIDIKNPYLVVNICICNLGIYPSRQ